MSALNGEQRSALEALQSGSVAVLAGPGSGKTHTLEAAVRSVLKDYPAARSLCLTFTNKAAGQLTAQLPAAKSLFVGTFHALAASLLQANGGLRPVADAETLLTLLGELKRSRYIADTNARELGLMISRHKNGSLTSDAVRRVTRSYDQALAERGLMDYDDIILEALETAREQPYDYIFVDEFQDTSPRQYDLLRRLSDRSTKLFVIGDPKQSIYRFRGADGSAFQRLLHDIKPRTINLARNYRSATAVVAAANRIFPDEPGQQAVRRTAGSVRLIETLDEYSEAEYIARGIEQSLGGTEWQHTHHDRPQLAAGAFRDFAVLYRTRRQGNLLAEKLRRGGLPVQCLGEDSPYAGPLVVLVKSLINYRLTTDEAGRTEVLRAARSAKLPAVPSQFYTLPVEQAPHKLIHSIAEGLGQTDSEALLQLENLAARFDEPAALLAELDALAGQSFFDPAADAVCLSTIHSSKGLEFQHVFVAGCNQGQLPSGRAEEPEALAEELRLFYVAVTRARDTLSLIHARRSGGKAVRPSAFLELLELPTEVDDSLAATERRRQRSRQKRSQQTLF